jgi:hypothetical protein
VLPTGEEQAKYQSANTATRLVLMRRRHSHQEMSPRFSRRAWNCEHVRFVRWIARAAGLNSGLTIESRHDQVWSAADFDQQYRGRTCRRQSGRGTCTASYENVIFSCLSQQPPGDTHIGKKRGMKCCRTRWCLIKELNYHQIHPQQQRIASRRLYFCNVALHKGHTLIHMATSLSKLKAI